MTAALTFRAAFSDSWLERSSLGRPNWVQSASVTRIEAYPIAEHDRIEALPRHFGRHMLTVERCIYDFMARFASAYSGGCWRFFELGNGGFYMSPPDDAYEVRIDSSGFQGCMSGDAAGITVCLFTFSHLSFEDATDNFARHFHWLRDFALDHPEAGVILHAMD